MDTGHEASLDGRNREGDGAARGSLAELQKLVQEFDTAMLVTRTVEGLMRARPMAVQEQTSDLSGDLWFVASIDSAKMHEIEHDPQVCVTFLQARGGAYASISARATIRRDQALVHKLWRSDWKAWWPKGPDDPQIAFLELQVERAEYWDPPGGAVRILYEIAKSVLKGESADRHLPPPRRI